MFGSMLVQYAIIWFLTLTTRSGMILTLATIAGFLPQVFISLFAGVWADRYPRKRLIIISDSLIAFSTLILAVSFLLGYRELWLILLVSSIRSLGSGIQSPAVSSLLPQFVPEDRLMKVNSINGTIQPVIMIIAPLLSGALMSYSRLEAVFFIDIITAALAVSLLLFLQVPPLPVDARPGEKTGYLDDLKEGLRFIARTETVKSLFIFFGFIFFLIVPVVFLTPLLVTRSFGGEVWKLTANEITFFVGSILGGLIMTAWGGFKNRMKTIGLSCIVWAGLFTALGFSKDFYLYLFIMFLAGIPMPIWNATTTTLLQEIVEPRMQGRVFGVLMLISTTIMPVGMMLFGPLADIVSIETLLIISSILLAIPGVLIFVNKQAETSVVQTVSVEVESNDYT